jgi:hypothetical protein
MALTTNGSVRIGNENVSPQGSPAAVRSPGGRGPGIPAGAQGAERPESGSRSRQARPEATARSLRARTLTWVRKLVACMGTLKWSMGTISVAMAGGASRGGE